ncbi:MAG TPA: hypothetical protein DEP03_00920 [Massilia sp.]|nr:hypothetical protein [Massilia sp.]
MAFISTIEGFRGNDGGNTGRLQQLEEVTIRRNEIRFPPPSSFVIDVDIAAAQQTLGIVRRRWRKFYRQAWRQRRTCSCGCDRITHE